MQRGNNAYPYVAVDRAGERDAYPHQASALVNGGNPMNTFFGAPNSGADSDLRASDAARYTNFQEWKAYEGTSQFLKQAIIIQIVESNTFYTSETDGLPIRFTDQRKFVMHEWIFDQAYAHREPTETVARIVRSGMKERGYQVIRRGLGVEVEHGFFHTPMGQRHFVLSLQQIVNAFRHTMNYDVVTTLLTCRDRDYEWQKEHGHLSEPHEDLAMRQAREVFALNKSRTGAMRVVYEAKRVFRSKQKPEPTCMWVPPNTERYFHGAGEEDTDYSRAGPGAYQRKTADYYKVNTFAGLRLHVTDIFIPKSDQMPIDPLVRTMVLGGYTLAYDPAMTQGERRPGYRDVYINCWKKDDHVRIKFEDMVRNAINVTTNEDGLKTVVFGNYGDDGAELQRRLFPGANNMNVDGNVQGQIDIEDLDLFVQGAVDAEVLGRRQLPSQNISEDIDAMHEQNVTVLTQNTNETDQVATAYTAVRNKVLEKKGEDAANAFTRFVNQNHDDIESVAGDILTLHNKPKGNARLLNKMQAEAPVNMDAYSKPEWIHVNEVRDNLSSFDFPSTVDVRGDIANHPTVSARINDAGEVVDKGNYLLSAFEGVARKVRENANLGNQDPTFTVLLLRPWQEFKTSTALLLNGGEGLGFTALGNQDAQFGTDTMSKRHHGHFTANEKAVLTDPHRAKVQDHIHLQDYLGGRATGFYNKDELDEMSASNWVPFDDPDRPSIISVILPGNILPDEFDNLIDIRGFVDEDYPKSYFPHLQPLHELFKFQAMKRPGLFTSKDAHTNTLCFQDFSLHYNPLTNMFDSQLDNKGHFEDRVQPGMRRMAESGDVWERVPRAAVLRR